MLTFSSSRQYGTFVLSSPDIREISGGLGTMYVVSWATKWTCRGSCHGSWAAWWTNISAYRVPLLRVFLGRETLIVLWETWKRKKRNLKQNLKKKSIFQNASIKSPCNTVSYHKGLCIQFSVCFYLIGFTSVKIINVNLLTPPQTTNLSNLLLTSKFSSLWIRVWPPSAFDRSVV